MNMEEEGWWKLFDKVVQKVLKLQWFVLIGNVVKNVVGIVVFVV